MGIGVCGRGLCGVYEFVFENGGVERNWRRNIVVLKDTGKEFFLCRKNTKVTFAFFTPTRAFAQYPDSPFIHSWSPMTYKDCDAIASLFFTLWTKLHPIENE